METIDLELLTQGKVRNLTGHERGAAARQHFGLTELDEAQDEVDIQVPDYLESMTTSFFQGMFAASVQKYGKDFLKHYHFQVRPAIMEQVMRGIDRVNTKRGSVL